MRKLDKSWVKNSFVLNHFLCIGIRTKGYEEQRRKGGKYLEKGNISCVEEEAEKSKQKKYWEKEKNCGRGVQRRRKRRKIFGEGKYFCLEDGKTEKEKEEKIW